MKKFFQYLKEFLKEYFKLNILIFAIVLTTVYVWIDYTYHIHQFFKSSALRNHPYRMVYFFVLYTSIFVIISAFTAYQLKLDFIKKRAFWIRTIFIMLLVSFDRISSWQFSLTDNWPPQTQYFLNYVVSNLASLVTIFIPILCFYYLSGDYKKINFYGFTLKKVDLTPYLWMLLLMVPLIFFAAQTKDFTNYYPRYSRTRGELFARYYQLENWTPVAIFEIAYAWSFFIVEFLMRGFFIIGFIKILGPHAVLPVACVYCTYHFGKPLGETISSFFGGYILGIFAFKTENIWGGIFIHVGIALLMELFAFLAL